MIPRDKGFASAANGDRFQSAIAFIEQLPLANPGEARAQLIAFLEDLIARPPEAELLLDLLEAVRDPMAFVEGEVSRGFLNKALPLQSADEAALGDVVRSWQLMVKGYATCARHVEPDPNDPYYAVRIATILHRCMFYTGAIMLDHFRARRELPANLWLDLHGYYETAEEWGVALTPLEDPLETSLASTHCTAIYVTFLLLDIASPYSHSVRQLNLIRQWAGMWAPLVSVRRLDDDPELLPPYVVELMKDQPLHHAARAATLGDDVRWLDTSRLALQIHHFLGQLQLRITPAQLGLGEESSTLVGHLLTRLARPWSQTASPRRFRRFPSSGETSVAIGWPAMHFHVAGKPFAQPVIASMYSHDAYAQLVTFGERVDEAPLTIEERAEFPPESWMVLNHSANGFRLVRSGPGHRVGHQQLLAVCPHDGTLYLLCRVTWLMQERDGTLVVGLSTLPGVPQPASVRIAGSSDAFVRAFVMEAAPAMQEPPSVILPSGLYQARRQLEIVQSGQRRMMRLGHILERGLDFDRAAFEVMERP